MRNSGNRWDLYDVPGRNWTGTAQVIPVPIVRGPVRGDRRNADIACPDKPGAARIGPRRITLIELADVPRRRRPHDLLRPAAIAVIDKRAGRRHAGKDLVDADEDCHYLLGSDWERWLTVPGSKKLQAIRCNRQPRSKYAVIQDSRLDSKICFSH